MSILDEIVTEKKNVERQPESLLTPQFVRDIEKEIAQHTQEFDNSMLQSNKTDTVDTTPATPGDKKASTTKDIVSTTKNESNDESNNKAKGEIVKPKQKRIEKPPIQAFQVIQLLRLIIIILLGALTGILIGLQQIHKVLY